MFSQEEIDAVLNDAQVAVDTLAEDVGAATAHRAPEPAIRGAVSNAVVANASRGERIQKLRVPVLVRLAQRRLHLNEILKMTHGTILEFDQCVDLELDLMVNNRKIGSGVAVKVNEHFGLRINRIGSPADRVHSLGRI